MYNPGMDDFLKLSALFFGVENLTAKFFPVNGIVRKQNLPAEVFNNFLPGRFPGWVAILEIWSASITSAPISLRMAETVDFPAPMPPVTPIIFMITSLSPELPDCCIT